MAVRRVRRIIRKIDPWTVLKASLVFNAVAALVFVLGTWVVWSMALQRGIPEQIVDVFESLTLTLTIDGELYFRIVVMLAVVGAVLATALMTLSAVLYNLISDLVGGVEITVLEETYNPIPAGTRTVIRPVVRRPVPNGNGGAQATPLPHQAASAPVAEPAPSEASPLSGR
jgi:hypothetical protein